MRIRLNIMLIALVLLSIKTKAQDNYEIQVYASPTMPKGTTMFELHSNFTGNGSRETEHGVFATQNLVHETIEITHGFADNFEIGIYFFNALGNKGRSGYVGSHIRPRFTAPAKWNLPFGLSLSTEVGYQKLQYSEDDWSLEIRPIIDKTIGGLYISLNPTVDKSFHGINQDEGFVFSPNFKASYAVSKLFSPGIEYYGSLGPFKRFEDFPQQNEQLFASLDVNFSPDWELNMGYGFGFTEASDKSIVKIILGRRIDWHKKMDKKA